MNNRLKHRLICKARGIQLADFYRNKIHITFILDGNRIVCYGVNNKYKTHPDSPSPYKTRHSELVAILNYPISDECKRYHLTNLAEVANRLTLVNIRLLASGYVAMAKPCKFCQRMLEEIPFKSVYYTDDEGEFIEFIELS